MAVRVHFDYALEEVREQMPTVLDPRVERGAALLDERMPGWAERVNADTLQIMSPSWCVLAQVFGHYFVGLDALGIPSRFDPAITRNGFAGPGLSQDWRLAILARTSP